MRKKSWIFLLIMFLQVCIFVRSEELKVYNYYERDYYGSFKLKELRNSNVEGYSLSKYEGIYNNGKLKEVKGYFYTGELKFIDTISDDKIIKTIYYYTDGEEIFVKEYKRLNGKIIQIKGFSKETALQNIYYEENYKESGDRVEVESIVEADYKDGEKNNRWVIAGKGYYNLKYQPVYMNKEKYIKSLPEEKNIFEEFYEYNNKGLETKYKVTVPKFNISITEINKQYNSKGELVEEIKEYDNGNQIFKTEYKGNKNREYFKNKEEKEFRINSPERNVTKIEKYLWISKSLYNDKDLVIKIYTQDERIYVDYEKNKIDDVDFNLYIDYFINNNLIIQPRTYIRCYASKVEDRYIYHKLD